MHNRLRVLFALAVVAVPATSGAAQIAVLAPQLKPPGPAELRDRFHDSVTRAMVKAGDVLPAVDVRARLTPQPDLLNCTSGSCVARAALALNVQRVVTVEVEYVGKDYTIRVRSFDAVGTDLGATQEEKCEICTMREAARAGERAAERTVARVERGLARPPAPAPGPITVEPPALAQTPAAPVTPAAAPSPATPAPSGEGRRSGYRLGAYTAFAVAGAALVAMIPFAYYASLEKPGTRGLYTGCDNSIGIPQQDCPRIFSGNTTPAVIFGIGAGVAAATGAVLLYLDQRSARKPTARFLGLPLRDGFAVSTSVEF